MLKKNDVICFQGDSVTDCGRLDDAEGLGGGYPRIVTKTLQAKYSDYNLSFYNRGISGHRTKDLIARWDKDCISLKPTILTLLIGINDVWRAMDANDPTSTEVFAENYEKLLTMTKEKTDAKIVVLEPFGLRCGAVTDAWRNDIDPKLYVIRKLAQKYADALIPLDALFSAKSLEKEPAFWAGDGVHPTLDGHRFIALKLLEVLDK